MPSYLHPGVYVEEIPSGSKPIEGVSTSVTAFIGGANRGPVREPVLIGKLDDYISQFGAIGGAGDNMGMAVLAFYLNGGKAAYICRLASGTPVSASVGLDGTQLDTTVVSPLITVTASSPGAWANNYFVRIDNADGTARTFDLLVGTQDAAGKFTATETLTGLSMNPASEDYVERRVADESSIVRVTVAAAAPADATPTDTAVDGDGDGNDDGVQLNGTTTGAVTAPVSGDYQSFYDGTLRKFRDVSIIVLPDEQWADDGSGNPAVSATQAFCETYKRSVLLIDLPSDLEVKAAADVTPLLLPTSTYTTLYYPWVEMANPVYNEDTNPTAPRTVNVPPSAVAAGMWAKIDGKRGVWKAPAGVEAQVNGISGLLAAVEDLEQDQLNPLGINCIRKLPGYGSVIWGSRTLATRADPEWRYVPVRRTAIFIEQSIYNGIQWAVFEGNDHPLWGSLRANIGSFMNGLFRSGAFQGATAKDAYFVRCGLGDTMTQGDIDRGQVIVIVGFAPLKPAEFVIVRIQQKVGQQ